MNERFLEVAASDAKYERLAVVAEQEGVPFKTMEKWWLKWSKHGVAALADGRRAPRATAGNMFYRDYKSYIERDANTDKGGYDAMLRDIRRGKVFSFGTWRDLWKADYPFEAVPPVCPARWVPKGFTYANMNRLLLKDPARAMATSWNRTGMFAASRHFINVIRSRAGLAVGAVYQADDVWHNVDVYSAGVKGVFNPLEFAFYDVASGYKAMSFMKPRMLVTDPKTGKEVRDNLKEIQFRFALQYLVCCKGFHKDGVLFILERGTTALRDNVIARLKAIPEYESLYHFKTSGVMSSPVAKGMFIGNAGGNPRMKSLCECAHGIQHNATASLPGSHGRDAAHLKENNAAVVKYSRDMIAQAERIDPAILPLLQLPILDWQTYTRYFYAIEDEVMDRTEHHLEGWGAKEVVEYRLDEGRDEWRNVAELKDMAPEKATAIAAVISTNPTALMRKRKMSRREAWRAGQKDFVKLPLLWLPAFADPRDMREAVVKDDGTIQFTDGVYYPGEKKYYLAMYRDLKGLQVRIAPGMKVKFYWNPLGELANQIWIADDDGEVLGIAPALKTAAWNDEHSIEIAMGQKAHQIAELMADTRARQAEQGIAQMAARRVNAALIEAAEAAKKAERDAVIGGDAEAVDIETLAGAGGSRLSRPDGVATSATLPADAAEFLDEISRV